MYPIHRKIIYIYTHTHTHTQEKSIYIKVYIYTYIYVYVCILYIGKVSALCFYPSDAEQSGCLQLVFIANFQATVFCRLLIVWYEARKYGLHGERPKMLG